MLVNRARVKTSDLWMSSDDQAIRRTLGDDSRKRYLHRNEQMLLRTIEKIKEDGPAPLWYCFTFDQLLPLLTPKVTSRRRGATSSVTMCHSDHPP